MHTHPQPGLPATMDNSSRVTRPPARCPPTQAVQSVAEGLLYDEDDDDQAADAPAAARGGSRSQQTVSLSELRQALLDADLRKLGSGCLPDDINRANSSSVKGSMVLQVGWGTREANSAAVVLHCGSRGVCCAATGSGCCGDTIAGESATQLLSPV